MKFKILVLFIVVSQIYAQNIPADFDLGKRSLSKTNDNTPASNSIEKIVINNNNIWLATGNGLSKSSDNGDSWINYYKTSEFGEDGISAIGFYESTIWVATWHIESKYGDARPYGSGLHYSQDGGTTWSAVPQPIDQPSDTVLFYGSNKIKALPILNGDQNYVRQMAFTKNTIWIATTAGGLRKSTDMGQTWSRVVLPPDDISSIDPSDTLSFYLGPANMKNGNLNHIGYSVLSIDDSTLFYGSYGGGFNKTTDGGKSWAKFNHENQSRPISGTQIMDIAYNKFDNSIWLSTWKSAASGEFNSICYSKDGGNSWETTLNDSKSLVVSFKYYDTPGAFTGSDIFAGTEDGLFRSTNNGISWITAPEIVDSKTKVVIKAREFRAVVVNPMPDNSFDIWIGSLDGLCRLNETNSNWTGDWKVFLASNQTKNANESYAFPNPFSPVNEIIRIKYSIQNSSDVTIRLFDFGMNLVRTLIQNASRNANDNQIEIWDGRDENGKIVPNGVYFYRIDIGSQEPMYGKIMILM